MRIAIPTNDRKSIANRIGRASEIAFYTINNGAIKSIVYTKNTHSHDDHRESEEHNHDKLLDILIDIDILLVRAVGKHMRKTLQKGNINYQLVKVDDITQIIADYL